MVSRHDIVLGVLPLIAASGIAAQYTVSIFMDALGIHVGIQGLPLVFVGLMAALLVAWYEPFVDPPGECS